MASVVQGKVIDYGSAPYKNDPANTESFYVELEGSNQDKRTLWGVGIRDAIQLKNIQNGEEVTFYDRGLAEGSKKRNWDVERYEKPKEYVNSLEEGIERQTEKAQSSTVNMDKEEQPLQRGRFKDSEEEAELDLPESIKNQYIYKVKNRALAGEKVNFYDREGDDGAIAFEDRNKSLHTSREDSKTIKAMVDVAQAKNWSSIKIKGTEAFKREVWLEATVRGVEVKGYQPNEKDLIELEKRKEGRSYNQVIVNEERSRELNTQKPAVATEVTIDKDKSNAEVADNWDAKTLVNDYKLSDYEAELIIKNTATRDEFEQAITSHQNEFGTERHQAIETLGRWAVEYEETKDIDQKVWDENNRLTGRMEIDDEVQDVYKDIDREALIRSNEFDTGRDIEVGSEVEGDVEQFHDNLATVTGAGISADEARRRVEASFDKKISPTQRNEVKEDLEEKLSDKDKIAIEAWRRVVNVRFKDDPIKRQEKHDALDAKIPEILEGKYNLQPPVITEQQNIEVATKDRGSQDRAR